jgi:1,4-dihydroxy-2-naphthoate polyprenyltransferase
MASATDKSVITCDLEGRIETFSPGAEHIFGWAKDEVVGKKRVSLFSPGEVVLQHVPRWLATAVAQGKYEGDTVFVRKDGTPFPAHIKITPTWKGETQIGYCGVTEPLPASELERARPRIALSTRILRWVVVMRAPFLTASLFPVLIGAAFAAASGAPVSWLAFALALIGALALQVAANTWNDVFDWRSGADLENNDYFLPFSGGSRAIELGLITEKGLLRIAGGALVLASLCGVAIAFLSTPLVIGYGVVGAFAAYFYTAPPLRLVARRGLGELFIGLCFGPLMTAGTYTAMTGAVHAGALLVGVPIGLLTTAILWINEFPDARSDAVVGKNHLVVTLGKRAARFGFLALIIGAFGMTAALVLTGVVSLWALASLLALPLAVRAVVVLFRHYDDRALVKGNARTIQLQALFGALFAAAIALS